MTSTTISRRAWIAGAAALGGVMLAGRPVRAANTINYELIDNPRGGYAFIPKVEIFSYGVVANKGFETVRASFRQERPFPRGFSDIEAHLRAANRPIQALCGLELRSGRQRSMPEFLASNKEYVELMRKFDLMVDGRTPLVRTNVAVRGTENTVRIHGFSYTRPALHGAPSKYPTFLSAGIPDVSGLGGNPKVIAEGDVSPAGLRQKTEFVLDSIDALLKLIGVRWDDVTGTRIYTEQNVHSLFADLVLPKMGAATKRGVELHYSRLPVVGGDIEIDVRSVAAELLL